MDYTETELNLLAQQEHTHSVLDIAVVGTEQDVRTYPFGTVYFYHANLETTANASPVEYILQGRPALGGAADHKQWSDLIVFGTSTTAAVMAAIIAAGEAPGQTQLSVKANPTAAFLRGTQIYILDKNDATGGEWHKVDFSATGGTHEVTVIDGIGVALVEDDELWTQAELFTGYVDLAGIAYIRALVLHTAATGSDIALQSVFRAVTDVE